MNPPSPGRAPPRTPFPTRRRKGCLSAARSVSGACEMNVKAIELSTISKPDFVPHVTQHETATTAHARLYCSIGMNMTQPLARSASPYAMEKGVAGPWRRPMMRATSRHPIYACSREARPPSRTDRFVLAHHLEGQEEADEVAK